jgi:4-hydroxybenzoate polyprenyltransferase
MDDTRRIPADSALPGWLASLPPGWQPYAMLARWDRPVGIWLLYLPCLIGLMFQRLITGVYIMDLVWAVLFLLGATAMRGAGCTWNDITDRDIDASVSRTALRPIPSGAVTLRQAYLFLGAQLVVGFGVWLALPVDAKLIALLSVPLVAAYPFMKRVTWWPQAWLGLTFNWGVLVGAAVATTITLPVLVLYAGLILWTIAYDTIYALQDREDDALIGVRSTARLFGQRAVLISFCFHMGATALIALAAALNEAGRIGALTAILFLAHGIWQAARLKSSREQAALAVFKSNVWAGLIVVLGFALSAMAPEPKSRSLFAHHEIVLDTPPSTLDLPFGFKVKRPGPSPADPGETWFASAAMRALQREGIIGPSPDDITTSDTP